MNQIPAIVTAIESMDDLTIVTFEAEGQTMRMMGLGLTLPIVVGSPVLLAAKASNIALAKELKGMLSTSNQLDAVIESVKMGEMLCSVKVRVGSVLLESITTRASALRMDLKVADSVSALIKASELSIVKVNG